MKLKIFFTSDVHGYVSPYLYSNGQLANQGLSRLSKFIQKNRDANSLLIDNGDILQGSALTYYHHLFKEDKINPMATCLNYLEYDYYNIGNHDFNYHQDVLKKYLNDLNSQCVTGNIKGSKDFEFNYQIKEIDGYRVAIVGATNDYIPNWEHPDNIKDLTFINAYQYLKDAIFKLKSEESYDYLVVVYHGGFEKMFDGSDLPNVTYCDHGYKLLLEQLGIDIFLTGHQHRSICQEVLGTYVIQTAANASELGYVEIDTITKEISGKLVKADGDIDNQMLALIESEEKACQKWLDQPIGSLVNGDCLISDEFRARLDKDKCVSFLNQIQLDHYQADISACALFNGVVGFNQDITMRDIVSTYIYPNSLVKIEITGLQLKNYLEKAAEYFTVKDNQVVVSDGYCNPKPIHFEYDMLDGIDYLVKASNSIGSRIIELKRNGVDVLDSDNYSMVISNYRYSGGGDYMVLKDCKVLADDGKDVVEIIVEYIMKNTPVVVDDKRNFRVIV